MDQPETNGAEEPSGVWSEELERVPLKQRLKMVLASLRSSDVKSETQLPLLPPNVGAEKMGNEHSGSQHLQSGCSAAEQMIETVSKEETHAEPPLKTQEKRGSSETWGCKIITEVRPRKASRRPSSDKNPISKEDWLPKITKFTMSPLFFFTFHKLSILEYAGELGELSNQENLSHKCMNSSHTVTAAATSDKITGYPVTVKVECADIDSPSAVSVNGSSLAGIQAVNFESDMGNDFVDELDHVVLKERLRWLLTSMMLKENFSGTGEGKRPGDQTHCGNKIHGNDKTMKPASSKSTVNSSCKNFQGNKSTYADSSKIQKNDTVYSSRKTGFNYESKRQKTLLSGDIMNVQGSTQPGLAHIKIEPPNSFNVNTEGQMSFMDLVLVKSEAEVIGDLYEDELDHMLLRERMKLLSPRNDPNSNNIHNSERMSKLIHSSMGCKPVASEPSQPIKINRPRKRRKTATDSIETAMEEDAPGLLQVLMKKGVSVNEIKLYGEPESNDALDDSSTNDNFAELETVIGKLFSRRERFLKFGPLRCTKGEKTSYCLECLFSLVEQARYLQFRNWPVEWGWCRDLQSFIFVFERHNRIVLERPEYGYATYFFELADSLPIDWQIKRLVTAMKLTNCSRVTLLENKALMVGDDLTEGEARVLMEYGWVPNTGLGTMLNYYDRVVHDRRNVDTSEWRSKIGKLLMDGYNGGTIISADIPTKAIEYNGSNPMQIKLELNCD